ncbi:MAG: hypothetical protein RL199_2263 [Pseudomonadota bacterium]|jgi:GT2 family glycosyltransferase
MTSPAPPSLVSVLVAVHDGAAWLEACLESVLAQTYPRWELIVVDDGSTDGSAELAEAFVARDPRVRLVRSGRNLGCAGARNLAMHHATGAFFAQLDADARASPDWLERMLAPFSDPAVAAVGGPDAVPDEAGPFERCVDHVLHSRLATAGLRRADTVLSRYLPAGCNLMLRASAVRSIGPYDTTMMSGGEEKELMLRLHGAGLHVRHVPEALVRHHRRTTLRKFARQMFRAGVSRVAIWRRQPHGFEGIHLVPALMVAAVPGAGAVSPLLPPVASALGAACAAFAILCLADGARAVRRLPLETGGRWRYWGAAAAAAAVAPLGYGCGMWWHLLTWPRHDIPAPRDSK